MRFLEPFWALLLIPIAVGLWLSRRHVHGMAVGRKRLSFAIRALLASLLVLALMLPQATRQDQGLATVFVLDRSDSVPEQERRRAEAFVRKAMSELAPEDLAGVVVYGDKPAVEAMPGPRRVLAPVGSQVVGRESDLASAMRLAMATFPEGKSRRIVVLSDGIQTRGEAADVAALAATEGIEVDHVPLDTQRERTEAALLELEAPTESRLDAPFDLRVSAHSDKAQPARIVIDRNGVEVARLDVSLKPGVNRFVTTQRLDQTGFARYRATLVPQSDVDNRNNVGSAFVNVRGRPRVLVLQTDASRQTLAAALREQGLDVDLGGAEAIPLRPEEAQAYDAILLNDLNAVAMSEPSMRILRAGVRDSGLGLAMIGGENSFLPGGWYGTAVAEALPVDLDLRQRKVFPSTAVLVAVDTSGSMAAIEDGLMKLQLAGKAAEQTVQMLSSRDRVGVAGSSDAIEFVAPLAELSDKAGVKANIQRLRPGGGGIFVEPSVAWAEKVLGGDNSKIRHFILLADGADADQHGSSLLIADRMRRAKITTTVIAIGDGKDVPFLRRLAAAGGGRFFLATRANQLPAIFTQDVSLVTRSAIVEGAFLPKLVEGEEILSGIDPGSVPPLLAYCLTDSRPMARVSMRTAEDDPLLATWQFGLGQTLAFTSDAEPKWARNWVTWGGFSQFWAQATRWVSRRTGTGQYAVSVQRQGAKGVVELRASDPVATPSPTRVVVSSPKGEAQEVQVSQEAPGVWRGEFSAGEMGSYIVSVSDGGEGVRSAVDFSGFSVAYPPEYRPREPDRALLQQISEQTRGRELQSPEQALRPIGRVGRSVQDLWMWFLLAAALLLPLDVAVRRLAIDPLVVLRKLFARKHEERVLEAGTVDRLRQAKGRVARAPEPTPQVTVRAERPRARESTPEPQGSAATRLLEAKRRRRGDNEP